MNYTQFVRFSIFSQKILVWNVDHFQREESGILNQDTVLHWKRLTIYTEQNKCKWNFSWTKCGGANFTILP